MSVLKEFKSVFNDLKEQGFFKAAGSVIGLLLLATSLINISTTLSEISTTRGVLVAKDNDAGRAIQTAILTRWYNSNHFAPYGNLYFRISHSIAAFSPRSASTTLTDLEKEELAHHFSMLVTSLFSLTALCLLFAYFLTSSLSISLYVGNLLLHVALLDGTWVQFLFRAHPDHLLMLACAVATFLIHRYTVEKSERRFIHAALAWGGATAVKRSTVLFIPSFAYLFASEGINKESLIKGLRFIGWMLVSYLIIGFPQNFAFYKHMKFMLGESVNSRSASVSSIMEYIILIFDQVKYLVLSFLFIHLIGGTQERLMNRRFFNFTMLGSLLIFSSQMVTPHEHHPMPFVAAFLVMSIFAIKCLPTLPLKRRPLWAIILSLGGCLALKNSSQVFIDQRNLQLECRTEISDLLQKIRGYQKDNTMKLGRDPFFPFDTSKKELSHQFWGASLDEIDQANVDLFGTVEKFGTQFLGSGPKYNMYENALNWDQKRSFYELIRSATTFTTPKGRTFTKIQQTGCGFQLWKRD